MATVTCSRPLAEAAEALMRAHPGWHVELTCSDEGEPCVAGWLPSGTRFALYAEAEVRALATFVGELHHWCPDARAALPSSDQ